MIDYRVEQLIVTTLISVVIMLSRPCTYVTPVRNVSSEYRIWKCYIPLHKVQIEKCCLFSSNVYLGAKRTLKNVDTFGR